MYKNLLDNYKISLISVLMLLISLSCDDQVPVEAEAPTLDYTITIQSEVLNCLEVGCVYMCTGDDGCSELNEDECSSEENLECFWDRPDDIAYSAGAKDIEDYDDFNDYEGYHLFFELKLEDINGEPVQGASLTIIEELLGEGIQQGAFVAFKDNDETNNSGIINGYWKDNGQSGDFIITVKYEDANEDVYSVQYPITILPTFDVVNKVEISNIEPSEILILGGGEGTAIVQAKVFNVGNNALENVLVTFEVAGDNDGSFTPSTSYTEAVEDTDGEETVTSIYAYSTYTTQPGVEQDVIDVIVSVKDEDGDILVSDTAIIEVTNEIAAAEDDVNSLDTYLSPSQLIIPITDEIEDSTYSISLIATVKDDSNEALADVTIDFEILTPENTSSSIGTLTTGSLESNSSGVVEAIIEVVESVASNQTLFKDSILVRTSITNPEDGITIVEENISSLWDWNLPCGNFSIP